MKTLLAMHSNYPKGLSLVELLIAIGILGVVMMLIAAAFPAGVAMSVAVSDDTTAQNVFQKGLGVVRDNYSIADVSDWLALNPTDPDLPSDAEYSVVSDLYLGKDGGYDETEGEDNRQYGNSGMFSWSLLMTRADNAGPMGNLCQAVVVISRKGLGGGRYVPDPTVDGDEDDDTTWSEIPELRRVVCTGSNPDARTLTIHVDDFELVPSNGYIIDGETGIAYHIISRNPGDPDTVTVFSVPPDDDDIKNGPDVESTDGDTGQGRYFWVIPGEYASGRYGRRSPAVRLFQTAMYLP